MIILLIYLLILGGMLLTYLVSYILKGIGMYTLGKARGLANPWLAFVPYARVWFQGELCGEIAFKNKRLTNPGVWMLLVPIVSNIITGTVFGVFWSISFAKIMQSVNMVSSYGSYSFGAIFGSMGGLIFIGLLLAIVFSLIAGAVQSILVILVNHQIFARYTDKNYALVHAVAGVFLPLYTSVYFFIIRNRESGINLNQE